MFELTCGILFAISLYIILDSNIFRKMIGISLLGITVNLIIFISGHFNSYLPTFINNTIDNQYANPVPQALVLTAIVIGFGLVVFLCILIKLLSKND